MLPEKTIVKLLREVLADTSPGPSRRKEILNLAIQTLEAQQQQIDSQREVIAGLRGQIGMWHSIADQRSSEINRLIEKLRKDGYV